MTLIRKIRSHMLHVDHNYSKSQQIFKLNFLGTRENWPEDRKRLRLTICFDLWHKLCSVKDLYHKLESNKSYFIS